LRVSAATEYLKREIQLSQEREKLPMVTLVTLQRIVDAPTTEFRPGVASYGWGINGSYEHAELGGGVIGFRFNQAYQWFSDRKTNPAEAAPSWQQFSADAKDALRIVVRLSGDAVKLNLTPASWGGWESDTTMYDEPSEQLIFSGVPGAGAGAPKAVMLMSFYPQGQIYWID
jgi:hypothetical protein